MRLMYARDYKLFAIASIALNIQNNPYITLNVLSASYLDFEINRLLCGIYISFLAHSGRRNQTRLAAAPINVPI